MLGQLHGGSLVIAPRPSEGAERRLSALVCLKALRWQVQELLLDGCKLAFLGLAHTFLRPLQSGLRGNEQPALGHAIMTKIKALIARRVVDGLPCGPPQRLADDLRHELEGTRNPRDKAELLELYRIVFAVEFAIGNELTRRGRALKGRKQCFGAILENLGIGGIAVPTFARQWHPAVLGDHEFQHRLFQVRPMVFGVAMGDRNGLLIALGDIRAAERKTRGVEMVKALINGFVLTHGKGDLAQKQITAIGVDLIKSAAECEAIEHIGFDTGTKEEIERLVGKELRSQRQWPIGKPSAIEDHPFDRLTGGDRLLFIRGKTSVDPAHESSIIDDGGNESQVI